MELTILIVSHNTAADLDACLRSLHQHPPRIPHEIVVIDNASGDESVAEVRSRWPAVRLIPLEKNIGFARANNAGFRQTDGELVLLLNSDTLVPKGTLDRLVQALRDRPGASIVGPRLVNGAGEPELSFGRMMAPLSDLRQKWLLRSGHRRIQALTSQPCETDWVTGACLLVRRSAAQAAGLLDERYFMYCEDVDFCAAVRAQGGRVYFVPEVEIVHLRGRSAATHLRSTSDAAHRSHLAFYRKHHPVWAPLLQLYLALQGKLPRQGLEP